MLDWEAALDDDRKTGIVQLLEEADPEVILGADIVCFSPHDNLGSKVII